MSAVTTAGFGTEATKARLITRTFWITAALLGALQAWIYRHTLSTPDIISYLDVSDAYLRGDWNAAINAYWSPLYSWLLAVLNLILQPSSYWEFPLVKLANFLIYLGALGTFEFFLRELLAHDSRTRTRERQPPGSTESVLRVAAYSLFLWSTLKWTGMHNDTPDIATAALVYAAAGLLLRVRATPDNWNHYALLGIVLGAAYLSKAALFPLSFVFIAVAALSAGSVARALPRALLAFLSFAVISAPFVTALSLSKDRLTFGDAGKFSYVWNVSLGSGVLDHWQGEQPGFGIPTHPTRKISDDLAIFEFASPIGGTFPPWYDPTYWNDGMKVRFDLSQQVAVLARNAVYYWKEFIGVLTFGYLAMLMAAGSPITQSALRTWRANWMLIVPALCGLGMYTIATNFPLAHTELQPSTRYISPFAVMLIASILSSVRAPNSDDGRRFFGALATSTAIVAIAGLLLYSVKDLMSSRLAKNEPVDWYVADGLHRLGLRSSDPVAILSATGPYYWARLARVRVIAEVSDSEDFWSRNYAGRLAVLDAVKETGAKVIVQDGGEIPATASSEGWQRIGATDSYAYFFKQP